MGGSSCVHLPPQDFPRLGMSFPEARQEGRSPREGHMSVWQHSLCLLPAPPALPPTQLAGLCSQQGAGGAWQGSHPSPTAPRPSLLCCVLPLHRPLCSVWKPFPGLHSAGQSWEHHTSGQQCRREVGREEATFRASPRLPQPLRLPCSVRNCHAHPRAGVPGRLGRAKGSNESSASGSPFHKTLHL